MFKKQNTKKNILTSNNHKALKLKSLAKKKENVRRKLVITAKNLAVTAKEKENVRRKLVVTAEKKENIRGRLAVIAKQLVIVANEKENVRNKLVRTAKQLATTAKEKENVRRSLVVTAKNLATTAKEKESIKHKLAITAETLRLKAKQLASIATEKEKIRLKLAVTAKNLATFAKEKELVRSKLVTTAKQLATTAKEKENVRRSLVVTAKNLAVTAQKIALADKYSRSLLEASLDPLITISPKGKITGANAATIKVTGIIRKELIGTDFYRCFTEPKKALAGYKKVFRDGSVIDYPLTIQSLNGKLTDVLYNASVYKDDKGNVLGVFAAARDVTESKKTDELMEIVRRKLAVTAKNLAVTAKEKELVRSKLAITAETLRLKAKQLASIATEKENIRIRLAVIAKKLVETAKEKEIVRNKLVTTAKKLVVTAEDKENVRQKLAVTAKKLKESYGVLEQAKSKDEAMLASIGDAVMACDKSGKVILFNIIAETLSGFSAKEAIGKHYSHVLNFIKENGEKLNGDFIAEAVKTGQKTKMESHVLLIKKDGKKIPVADSAAPVKNTKGKIIGCVVVFRDISLEREVIRMKDEFLSLASHELRTPMTSIAGFIDMILEGRYGQLTKELREPLGYVAESTDRLIRLVNDLLDVSRIEAGRMIFNMGPIDLSGTVYKVVAGLQPIALKRNIKLTFDNNEVVQVQGDIEKVEQILNNLIGNALKFTDRGGISVVVKNIADLGEVEITDTGVGIPMEGRNRLFGKFEQINTDPAGRPPGTGLGLYLSHQMAQKMGGDIKLITSTLGKGSAFGFSLPVAGSALSKQVLTEIKGSIVNKE